MSQVTGIQVKTCPDRIKLKTPDLFCYLSLLILQQVSTGIGVSLKIMLLKNLKTPVFLMSFSKQCYALIVKPN